MNEFFAWITGLVALIVPGFGVAPVPSWNGYVEADYVYVSAPAPGTIAALAVTEGQMVTAGEVLFSLSEQQYRALVAAADARVASAEAALMNLTTGSREAEVEVVKASLDKAEADLSLARETSARSGKLFAEGLIPQSRYDQDRATLASAEAAVRQLQAQLKVAQLPARDAQQIQAEANLAAAEADAAKARADLADRTVVAPVDGRVDRLYYAAGEMAVAGVPVIAILPADALKVKFYVPEAERAAFVLGDEVMISCDGCADRVLARLSFVASDPQFTPPVIYSRDERQRLSFLAEATILGAGSLLPGQPVTVARPQ